MAGLHFNIASEMAQGKYYYIKIVREGENSPGTPRSDSRHSRMYTTLNRKNFYSLNIQRSDVRTIIKQSY